MWGRDEQGGDDDYGCSNEAMTLGFVGVAHGI